MIYYTTICTYIINLRLPIFPQTKNLPICGAELLIPVSSSISSHSPSKVTISIQHSSRKGHVLRLHGANVVNTWH